MRPNVALGALDAPNATLGALDAPNATLGALDAPNATLGRIGEPPVRVREVRAGSRNCRCPPVAWKRGLLRKPGQCGGAGVPGAPRPRPGLPRCRRPP